MVPRPTRRKILDELADRDGQTLFEIRNRLIMKHQLGSSRQAISQHLDVLEDAGLIETRREGRFALVCTGRCRPSPDRVHPRTTDTIRAARRGRTAAGRIPDPSRRAPCVRSGYPE